MQTQDLFSVEGDAIVPTRPVMSKVYSLREKGPTSRYDLIRLRESLIKDYGASLVRQCFCPYALKKRTSNKIKRHFAAMTTVYKGSNESTDSESTIEAPDSGNEIAYQSSSAVFGVDDNANQGV